MIVNGVGMYSRVVCHLAPLARFAKRAALSLFKIQVFTGYGPVISYLVGADKSEGKALLKL